MLIFFQGGPFQIYFCFRVYHFDTQSKGIDIGSHAVDRIVRDVADFVRVCHNACQNADQEFGFIHTSVVSADIFMRSVQGTVQDLYFRVVNRSAQAGT